MLVCKGEHLTSSAPFVSCTSFISATFACRSWISASRTSLAAAPLMSPKSSCSRVCKALSERPNIHLYASEPFLLARLFLIHCRSTAFTGCAAEPAWSLLSCQDISKSHHSPHTEEPVHARQLIRGYMCVNVKKSRARTKIHHFVEMGVGRYFVFLLIVVLDHTVFVNTLCFLSGHELHCALAVS